LASFDMYWAAKLDLDATPVVRCRTGKPGKIDPRARHLGPN
jgi:hypothetical protein